MATKAELEDERYDAWSQEHYLDSFESSLAFSMWQINNTLEKLIKTIKEK